MGVEELRIVELLDAQHGINLVVRLNVQHVLNGTALRVLVALWYLIALLPVASALLGEEEQRIVHRGRINIFGEVVVAMTGTLGTQAAASLCAELAERRALDVTHVRNGNNHGVVGIEILGIKLVVKGDNLRLALVAVLLLHFEQIVFHHLLATLRVVQNLFQVSNQLLQVVIFLMQLVDAQARQLRQTHIDDGLRLSLVQVEAFFQIALGIARCSRLSDDVYHLVNIVHGNNQPFQNVGTLTSLAQVILCATDGHVVTMVNEVADAFLQREQTRTQAHTVARLDGNQRNVINRE